jgi:hypothetical protein
MDLQPLFVSGADAGSSSRKKTELNGFREAFFFTGLRSTDRASGIQVFAFRSQFEKIN